MRTMMKKLWRLGFVYLVAVNLLQISPALAGGPPQAAANNFRGRVEVTFIKWVTNWPNMAGVVSGDVGGGTFAGEVLNYNHTDAIDTIEALYHINGGALQFTAHNIVTQDNLKGTAVIKGSVTDGSLKGARVSGEYQVISPCGIINAINGTVGDVCFQGNLIIKPGSED
jgi:hypothetical protein